MDAATATHREKSKNQKKIKHRVQIRFPQQGKFFLSAHSQPPRGVLLFVLSPFPHRTGLGFAPPPRVATEVFEQVGKCAPSGTLRHFRDPRVRTCRLHDDGFSPVITITWTLSLVAGLMWPKLATGGHNPSHLRDSLEWGTDVAHCGSPGSASMWCHVSFSGDGACM